MHWPKYHQKPITQEQSLLSEAELAELRLLAEQVDCSATLSQTLLSKQAGWLPTHTLGSSMDYAESRVYLQGDDPRYIDWRVSARSTETFVKTYHMESRPSLCIVLDKRRSMLFGTRSRLKVAQALRIAVMLAHAAEQHGLAINVLVIDDQLNWVECFEINGIMVSALIREENSARFPIIDPSCDHDIAESNLKVAIDEVHQHVPKGSLIYVISDFIELDNTDKPYWVELQSSYFVEAVHIMDQAEINIPPIGNIRLQNINTQQQYSLNSSQQNERQAYEVFAQQQARHKKQIMIESGVSYLRVMTNQEQIHQLLSLPLENL